jgi:exodeoxyribonuclease-3
MRIVTYNVNGLRSAMSKGLLDWLRITGPDVLCLQEIKATPEQVGVFELEEMGYHHFWHPAEKKGYSGVAIFAKIRPKKIEIGCGIKQYDAEGRVLRIDNDDLSILNVYHPSGSSGDLRQSFKMKWLGDFREYITQLRKDIPNLILCGDFNICHKSIDIHNPVANAKTSGFLPEERKWMDEFMDAGFIDSFRHFNSEPHQYSWWSYRTAARERNLGWRIDYNLVADPLKSRLKSAAILADAVHSDHCPVLLEII